MRPAIETGTFPAQTERKGLRVPLLKRVREVLQSPAVLRETLEAAENTTGCMLRIWSPGGEEAPAIEMFVPPDSLAAHDLVQKIRTFVNAEIALSDGYFMKHPAQRGENASYTFWLNPDYAATANGQSANRDDLSLRFSTEERFPEEEVTLLDKAHSVLFHFDSASHDQSGVVKDLLHWEIQKRQQLAELKWQINDKGESQAVVENTELEQYFREYKDIWNQTKTVQARLETIKRSLRQYSQLQALDLLDQKTRQSDSEPIRQAIRDNAREIESGMRQLFRFLSLSDKIFSVGDLSFADPNKIPSEKLEETVANDIQSIEKFISWVQRAVQQLLMQEVVFKENAEKGERTPEFVQNILIKLSEIADKYPDIQQEQIALAYGAISTLSWTKWKNGWTNAERAVANARYSYVGFSTRHKDVLSLVENFAKGYLPQNEERQKAQPKIASSVSEAQLFLGESHTLIKILKSLPDMNKLAEILEEVEYASFPEELRAAINTLVGESIVTLDSLATSPSTQKQSVENGYFAAQSVAQVLEVADTQVQTYRQLILDYLESSPDQT